MKYFLTSSPFLGMTPEFNPANHFTDNILAHVPNPCKCIFVTSDPQNIQFTDAFACDCKTACQKAGITFSSYEILDGRTQNESAEMIKNANFIILAGGHVPTQNTFFQLIRLASLLKDFQGVILGISAGSMNASQTVYAIPELKGEATNPDFERFLPGLGITQSVILPHFQSLKDESLDGMDLVNDIALKDSCGHSFICLNDGSYLYGENGKEIIYGESYVISNKVIKRLDTDHIPEPGEIYRHYKGHVYKIITIATHSETLSKMVVYEELSDTSHVWARPIDMWNEVITVEGVPQRRFTGK